MNRSPRLTFVQWTVCVIASIGFAFDIYELLMMPLIMGPALQELVGAKPGTPQFEFWVGILFFVPALVGGVFGLLGGYLTDLWGRRRVLVFSILLYAFSALAAGFSTSVEMLLILALHDLHRRVRGVCGSRRVAGRAVSLRRSSARRCWDSRRPSPRWEACSSPAHTTGRPLR